MSAHQKKKRDLGFTIGKFASSLPISKTAKTLGLLVRAAASGAIGNAIGIYPELYVRPLRMFNYIKIKMALVCESGICCKVYTSYVHQQYIYGTCTLCTIIYVAAIYTSNDAAPTCSG